MDQVPVSRLETKLLLLSELHESPLNPRKHYDQKSLQELADNIAKVGILSPLLVRPAKPSNRLAVDGYEIGAGHRRYRAARLAKLTEVPVIVRPMDDAAFLELLCIENLQREDLHPMDEAQGFRTLMEKAGYDVDAVAAKVGKSKSYIYQRLKLADLIDPAKKAFLEEQITAGHAILIARLQPKDQADALKYCEGNKWNGPASVRDLSQHIQRDIHLDLSGAPWKKDDATLVPAAGPCTTCPKRTGFSPDLFPDITKKDICTDRACFQAKGERFLAKKLEAAATAGEPLIRISTDYGYHREQRGDGVLRADRYREAKPGSCAHATKALVVEGRDLGQTKTICAEHSCKTHRGYYSTGRDESWRKKQATEEQRRRREADRRRRILVALRAQAVARLDREDLNLIALAFANDIWADYRKQIVALEGWEAKKQKGAYGNEATRTFAARIPAMKDSELSRLLLTMALIKCVDAHEYDPDKSQKANTLLTTARRHGVDIAAIDKQWKAEETGRARKAKARQKKAKVKSDGKADPSVIKLEDICKLHGVKATTKEPKARKAGKPVSQQTGEAEDQKTVHTSAL